MRRAVFCSAAAVAALSGTTLAGVTLLGTSAAARTPRVAMHMARAATPDPGCTASAAPSYTPDPVLGSGVDKYFGDAELATIPSTSTTIGIPSPTSTTGSMSSPVNTENFAAGYLDETELYEYVNNSTSGANPAGSPGAYDATQPLLNNLPVDTVKHLDGSTSTGAGLPYAAILSSDLSHVIATVPVTITDESYTVDPTAWMPGKGRQPTSTCGANRYAAMTFSASGVHSLQAGQTYAAYLVVRDTDVSGPLANHIWYFTPSDVAPAAYAGYAHTYPTGSTTPSTWDGSSGVIFEGCNYFTPDRCAKTKTGADRYDAGAIRLVNPNAQAIDISNASVTIGSCTFQPWPGLNVSVPGGGQLILTQTGLPSSGPCGVKDGMYGFDTSDTSGKAPCTNDGLIPVLNVTADGANLTYRDTSQILNTGGMDVGSKACGVQRETHDWGAMSGPS